MPEYTYILSLLTPAGQTIAVQHFTLPLICCRGFDTSFHHIPSGTYRARVHQVTVDGSMVDEMHTSLVVESSDSGDATVHVMIQLRTSNIGNQLRIQTIHAEAAPSRLIFTPYAPGILAKEESIEEFRQRVDQLIAEVNATQEDMSPEETSRE